MLISLIVGYATNGTGHSQKTIVMLDLDVYGSDLRDERYVLGLIAHMELLHDHIFSMYGFGNEMSSSRCTEMSVYSHKCDA